IIDALPQRDPFTVREISHKATENPMLREALSGFIERSGVLSTRRFGRYLLRYEGTRIAGRWIERTDRGNTKGVIWAVRSDDGGDPEEDEGQHL
ncbi:hypothetical protein AB4144_57210, partial [Rhizobiaceae sp. 2RAB30]